MKIIDISIGTKINYWTVIGNVEIVNGRTAFLCRCKCDKVKYVQSGHLRYGKSKMCRSCSLRGNSHGVTHGMKNHPLYAAYKDIVRRCEDVTCVAYMRYGGRGISVCQEWKDDVFSFISWGEENGFKRGFNIDRIDNDKGYSPSNCRFCRPYKNQRNRSNNKIVEYNGKSLTLVELCQGLDLDYECVRVRILRGWSVKKSIETPTRRGFDHYKKKYSLNY